MEDKGSKKVVDLFVQASENKDDIALYDEEGSHYSVAEMTVLSCLEILAREAEMNKLPYHKKEMDYDMIIKTLIVKSLDGMTADLRKKDEYNRLIEAYKRIDFDVYPATVCYKSMLDNFNNILYPVNPEERFVREHVSLHETYINESESVLNHMYGCLVLAVGLESEYDYKINYSKLIKMILVHESDKLQNKNVFSILSGGDKLMKLNEEFNNEPTLESEYANLIDKLEKDMSLKASRESRNLNKFSERYERTRTRYNRLPCLRRILEETKNI